MDFISFFKKTNASSVLEYIPDGLILTDLGGKILSTNDYAKSLIGIDVGQNIAESLDVNIAMIESIVKSKTLSIFKVNKDSVDIYVELNASKIGDEAKFVITIRDVTQAHKFMKKMLVESESSKKVNRDKNSFLVKIENELKSPLHSIDGFSKALLEGLGGELNEKQEKYLNIINKNSQELLYLIEKVVEQARLESGLYDLDFKHLDIVNLFQLVVRPYQDILQEKSINLTVDIEKIVKRTCFVDELALKTVMNSLLDLAIKSTYLGNIHVEIKHPDIEFVKSLELECPEDVTEKSFVQFTITDSGNGMAEADCGTIFDAYYQVENGNKKNVSRSLALAINKTLIKNFRGLIWAEGQVNQGSRYSFVIPNERFSV